MDVGGTLLGLVGVLLLVAACVKGTVNPVTWVVFWYRHLRLLAILTLVALVIHIGEHV